MDSQEVRNDLVDSLKSIPSAAQPSLSVTVSGKFQSSDAIPIDSQPDHHILETRRLQRCAVAVAVQRRADADRLIRSSSPM
jgi:hypothetical protein